MLNLIQTFIPFGFTEYDFSQEQDTSDQINDFMYLGSCKSCLDVVNHRPDIKYILNLSQYKLFAPNKNVLELDIDDCPDTNIIKYFDKSH